MKKMLEELEGFSQEKNFIKYGFGASGGHLAFIDKARTLSKSKNRHIREKSKLLVMIAYCYAASRGMKTDKIRKLTAAFNE